MLGKKFYETKMPLISSLIIKKGNLWRITKQMATYGEENIQEIFGEEYLPNIEQNFMPFVYLVRCKIKENRTIWTLIHPKYKEYKFFFVDRSINSNNDELLNLARKHIGKNDSLISINTFKT